MLRPVGGIVTRQPRRRRDAAARRYWCVAPLFLLAYWRAGAAGGRYRFGVAVPDARSGLVVALVWAWAWRFFLLYPWDGWFRGLDREDWRYEDLRKKLGKAYWPFARVRRVEPPKTDSPRRRVAAAPRPRRGWAAETSRGDAAAATWMGRGNKTHRYTSLHLTPTLLVFGALAPAGRVATRGGRALSLNWLDGVALVWTLGALALEASADETLKRHRAAKGSRQKTCVEGAWAWSRHPNYLGECCFWTGLWLFGLAAGETSPWLAVGPALMWAFFRFASCPLMEARNAARRDDYASATARISVLVPTPF